MASRLLDLVDQYELSREISRDYAYQMRYAVGRFGRWLGRDPVADDLAPDTVNAWLMRERDAGEIADRSRANVRRSILTLWKRFWPPLDRDRIRSVVVTPRNPEAWHFDELAAVADAAGRLGGELMNGVPRGLYFRACLWFAYETGLRRRDCWLFNFAAFGEDRRATITQHKTRRVHLVQITSETMRDVEEIRAILRRRRDRAADFALRWPQCVTTFYYWMRAARVAAGVDPFVSNRSLQHIRRTGATEVAREGGAAWRFLGHTREGLDRISYVDAAKTSSPNMPQRTRTNEQPRSA
jgi:hypothetical protein